MHTDRPWHQPVVRTPAGLILVLVVSAAIIGCGSTDRAHLAATQPTLTTHPFAVVGELTPPLRIDSLETACVVPVGWIAKPLETKGPALHQVWISPTGSTAYGVMRVQNLLLPLASDSIILSEFLRNMKASEGRADLISKKADSTLANGLGGIRFAAEGGRYSIQASLVSSGTRAWVVYAGTLAGQPIVPVELLLAERAREQTVVDVTITDSK